MQLSPRHPNSRANESQATHKLYDHLMNRPCTAPASKWVLFVCLFVCLLCWFVWEAIEATSTDRGSSEGKWVLARRMFECRLLQLSSALFSSSSSSSAAAASPAVFLYSSMALLYVAFNSAAF